jgi:hypothetical protein
VKALFAGGVGLPEAACGVVLGVALGVGLLEVACGVVLGVALGVGLLKVACTVGLLEIAWGLWLGVDPQAAATMATAAAREANARR